MQMDRDLVFPHTVPDQSLAVQGAQLQVEHAAKHVFVHS